jgi:hypothetical protein
MKIFIFPLLFTELIPVSLVLFVIAYVLSVSPVTVAVRSEAWVLAGWLLGS